MFKGRLVWLALSVAVASGSWAVGCGDSTPDPKTAPPPMSAAPPPPPPPMSAEVKKEEPPPPPKPVEPPPPPPKTAKDVIVPGTVFMLSVDDSMDAKKAATDPCAKKKKDEDKKKCTDDATAMLAKEGVRFDKDDKSGGWVYVAFSKDAKDKEVDLHKVPVKDPKEDGPNKYTFTLTGKDGGKKAIKYKEGDKWSVDLVDENTIAVMDDKRGKLIYKKK
jgi:type IV secretory pathway VirB10-like protein